MSVSQMLILRSKLLFLDYIHGYIMLKKADFIYILNAFTMCNNKHQNP